MKTYYSTKRVEAVDMPRQIEGHHHYEDGREIHYQDGYVSWCPEDVFQRDYQPITAMSFGHALDALKRGERVARAGWNGAQTSGFIPPTREPVVYDGVCHILLDTGAVAICDAEDIDKVRIPRADGQGFKEWYADGSGYPAVSLYEGGEQRNMRLHKVILGPASDHENGDVLDNRSRNLRPASAAENNANRASVTGSSSRFKGVTWDKSRGKWVAACNSRTLGRFDDEKAAARAYDIAAKAAYGRFARLNFPSTRMWLMLIDRWSMLTEIPLEDADTPAAPFIAMRTAAGEFVPWLASQTDMLADDWQIVEG